MDQQIGNVYGVAANGNMPTILSTISADGANTITVSDINKFRVGQSIDIVNITTGVVLATNRLVTSLTSAGVLTYNGADATAVPGTHGVYRVGGYAATGAANLNGGTAADAGFRDFDHPDSVLGMKNRLIALDPTTFTTARLAAMTFNDLVYAIRMLDAPLTVR